MKQIIITLLIVFTSLTSFTQIQPTKASINDFAVSAYIYYKYGNGMFASTMNRILMQKGYSKAEAAVVMENLKTDSKGREIILEGIANFSGDKTSLFNQFYALEMSAKNANDLAYYVYETYSKKRFEGN